MLTLLKVQKRRGSSHILFEEELPGCYGDRSVSRVDQVIDALAVLRAQHLICATVDTNRTHMGDQSNRAYIDTEWSIAQNTQAGSATLRLQICSFFV